MEQLIKDYYNKSEELRKGYLNSLGSVNYELLAKFKENMTDISEMFVDIYSISNGTESDINEQRFFDFIPGFRLMQLEEVINNYKKMSLISELYDIIVPFLIDYAGCYFAYGKKEKVENIIYISEDGIEVVHSSVKDFWITINAFYDEKVFFLDEDGYLAYDFELEGIIGKRLNPQIEYWG